ncbi:peptidylprolyl isomerase [Arhodomonas aquaeolei]|nr:peptidylprolyl isomerase [Arhodomonas aquaeolei]MCS4502937.1 peptidylprolyl isomerase [Arhodomonas aquaeolei]
MSLYRCIAAAFLTLALAGPAAAQLLDRIVAVVNEDVILMSEFQDELAQVRSQLQQRDIEAPSEQELRQQVLERLVVEQLQIDAANRRGITVDQATLDAAVRRVAERNNLDLRGFRDALVNQGMSMDGFRERLRRQILVQRLRQRVMDQRVNVTPQEIEQYTARLAEDQQEYHLRHILVALPEAASPEAISDARDKAEALRRQLTEGGANFATLAAARSDGRNALEGGDLGWRRAGELPGVIADRLNALDPGGISEVLRTPSGFHLFKMEDRRAAERHVVTQSHIRHIMIQTNEVVTDSDARKRLQSLRQRIEGGASFEALARANSDDKATAADGGDMGWLGPQEMPPAVRRAVEGMQAGSVSRAFKSRNGWHLIQLVEQRRKDTTEAYRRNQAAEQLRQRKEDEELELWLRQLREEAYVDYRLDNPAGAANS